MSKWISVYEKCPSSGTIVWVYWRNREVLLAYQTLSAEDGFLPNEHWYSLEDEKEKWAEWWMPVEKPKFNRKDLNEE